MSTAVFPDQWPVLPEACPAPQAAVGEATAKTIVLAGNPNVGKSVFFNAWTGQYVNISNFPGTTVDILSATLSDGSALKDSPGVYGLSRMSDEEQVAETAIMAADVVVNVVSALTLDRDLFLTQQLIDFGKPLVVAVNQMDELAKRNQSIDLEKLSQCLGVPVFGTVATEGRGMESVRAAISQACVGHAMPGSPPAPQLLELESDPGQRLTLYGLRRQHVNAIVRQVLVNPQQSPAHWSHTVSGRLGRGLLTPVWGGLSMVLTLLALYQIIGVWVAGDLVNLIEGKLLLGTVVPWIQKGFQLFLPTTSPLYVLLAGEFGTVTMSLQYIVGVIFPLVLGFYLYLSVLEDSGYLPRVAVLSDGLLTRIGLNGRAIIPMILGLGCVTMATLSTRVLSTQRERTIASTLLAITIPCSAQLGVIMGLMAVAGGLKAWGVYCALLFAIFIVLGTVLNAMLPGRSSPLVLDLPPMRLPRLNNVAKKTWTRTRGFIAEATPLFILGTFLVALCQVTGLLDAVQVWLAPLTQSILHLPAEAAQVFIMGMVRRDFGVAGLYFLAGQMTALQVMTSLIVITLFVPCIASAAVLWKERGWREGVMVLAGSWLLAFATGAVLTRLLEFIKII